MTNAEKQALLRDLAGIRTVLDSAMLQLKNLELRLGPPSDSVSNAGSPQERPADALLTNLRCYKCGSPMQWRFARSTAAWFAGCESFRRAGCKGSMSYEFVMERQPGAATSDRALPEAFVRGAERTQELIPPLRGAERLLDERTAAAIDAVIPPPDEQVDHDEAWQRAQDDADREAQYDHANAAASPES